MGKRIKIPRSMLSAIEAHKLAEWQAGDDCKGFPVCLEGDEKCTPGCAGKKVADAQVTQWGDG